MRRNNHIDTRQVIQYCISMRSIGHQNSMRRIRILPKKLLPGVLNTKYGKSKVLTVAVKGEAGLCTFGSLK